MATAVARLITAANVDFEVYEGDTPEPQVILNNDSGPIDLSAAAIKMQVRPAPGQTVQQEFSTTNGKITVGGADNNVMTITGWAALTVGTYQYDLQVTIGSKVTTYLYGKVIVTQDITEP